MSANLILGSSHGMVLARAAGRIEADWRQASAGPVRIETGSGADTSVLFATNRPDWVTLTQAPGGGIGATFGAMIDQVRAYDRDGCVVVLALGGNEHNIRFLTAHPQPFDFDHPPVPGIDPARQLIPAREMATILRGLLERTLAVTRLIAAELPKARRYYLAPPPPIASEAQIRSNPAIFDFAATGVEDARVRLKIYDLYLSIAREFAAANGLAFLEPVAAFRDADGFLAEPYWEGATHALPAYYAGVVADLGL